MNVKKENIFTCTTMSLNYDVIDDNSAEEFDLETSDDTSSYHGSCELSDSQEDLCDIGMCRRGSSDPKIDR